MAFFCHGLTEGDVSMNAKKPVTTQGFIGSLNVRQAGVAMVIGLVPLLAPLPTAWVVGTAMVRTLHWPWPVALVGAMIIEGLGFGTVDTAMRMRDYNKTRRKRFDVNKQEQVYLDPPAPTFYAVMIIIVYLAVAVSLTVLLDILPNLALYARGIFPFLGVLGAGLWALRADHDRRIAEKEIAKQEQREERKAAREAKVADNSGKDSRKEKPVLHESRRKETGQVELLAFWKEHPEATDGEVAKHFGIERQAIWQRRHRLMKKGLILWDGSRVEMVEDLQLTTKGTKEHEEVQECIGEQNESI